MKSLITAIVLSVVCSISVVAGIRESSADPAVASDELDPVPGSISLGEVVVTARVKPVFLRGDTIVINPAAFRLRDGAYLEELVRCVPGLTYDKTTGHIAYYGESLNGVLVNGKKFFGPDTDIAMENMPVELLDEVKIYKRNSDEGMQSAMASESSVYVIDLGTKGNLEAMTTANAEAGAGNKDKKYLSGSASRHKSGGDRIVMRGSIGNKNMETTYPDARKDNLSLSFGKKVRAFDIDGKIDYNNDITGNGETRFAENYLPSGNNFRYGASENASSGRSLAAQMGARGRIGKRSYLDITGAVGGSKIRNRSLSRSSLFSHDPGLSPADPFGGNDDEEIPRQWRINDDISASDNRTTDRNYNLAASFSHFLPGAGCTTIALRLLVNGKRIAGNNNTLSEITYYRLPGSLGEDSLLSRRRYDYLPRSSRNLQAGVDLSRNFGKNFSAKVSYTWSELRESDHRDVYGFLPEGDVREYLDSLSSYTDGVTGSHEFALNLHYEMKDFRLNAGLRIAPRRQTLDRKNGAVCGDTLRRSVGLAPSLQMLWQVRNLNIDFRYAGNTTEPDLSQLMMMTDNSNPLYIIHGNPELKTSYSQEAGLRVSNYLNGLSGEVEFSNTYNSIVQAQTYNPTSGGYETYPVNINGLWNLRGHVWKHQYFGKGFEGSFGLGWSRSQYVSLLNRTEGTGMMRRVTHTDGCQVDLTLSYRSKIWNIGSRMKWDYMRSVNRLNETVDYTRNYEVNLFGRVDLPSDLFVDTNMKCLFRNGSYVSRDDRQDIRWNMSVGWRFMKRKMTLTVEWFDILNKSRNIMRSVNSSGLYETHVRNLGSYFLVSLSFKLSDMMIFDIVQH